MKEKLLIVAVGLDRAGLANELTHEINVTGCTIHQTHMQTIGEHFAMLLEVAGDSDQIAAIRSQATGWGERQNLDISLYGDGERPRRAPSGRPYTLRVDALERAGIIDDVTRVLRGAGAHVSFLEGNIEDMPFSGEQRFVLQAGAEIPPEAVAGVEKALAALGLDYVLDPA